MRRPSADALIATAIGVAIGSTVLLGLTPKPVPASVGDMVSLRDPAAPDLEFCAGQIVSAEHVLTAAHCTLATNGDIRHLSVHLASGAAIEIADVSYATGRFNPADLATDIALITTNQPIAAGDALLVAIGSDAMVDGQAVDLQACPPGQIGLDQMLCAPFTGILSGTVATSQNQPLAVASAADVDTTYLAGLQPHASWYTTTTSQTSHQNRSTSARALIAVAAGIIGYLTILLLRRVLQLNRSRKSQLLSTTKR